MGVDGWMDGWMSGIYGVVGRDLDEIPIHDQ
jgi:hypothetical protein